MRSDLIAQISVRGASSVSNSLHSGRLKAMPIFSTGQSWDKPGHDGTRAAIPASHANMRFVTLSPRRYRIGCFQWRAYRLSNSGALASFARRFEARLKDRPARRPDRKRPMFGTEDHHNLARSDQDRASMEAQDRGHLQRRRTPADPERRRG